MPQHGLNVHNGIIQANLFPAKRLKPRLCSYAILAASFLAAPGIQGYRQQSQSPGRDGLFGAHVCVLWEQCRVDYDGGFNMINKKADEMWSPRTLPP